MRGNAEFISIKDAAELLAVSEITIRRMVMRGELRGYRVGRRLIRLKIGELENRLVGDSSRGRQSTLSD